MVVEGDKKVRRERTFPTFAEGYRLLECVGRGSEGSVWRALCIPIKQDVAIKIIDLEKLPSSTIADFHLQIQAMYQCSKHPHVVRYYTSFVNGQSLWCVMKYLSGGSCSDIMRISHQNGLDEAAIKIILKDILKALEYFHANGRIHRDIKAGNIVISETGSVQLADFGVSGSLVEQLRTTLCGSPCWMAPEVMLRAYPQGKQMTGYNSAVDIWSLGITALELAKGRPPFAEYSPSKVFSMVVQNPPPALDDASKKKFSSSFKEFVSLCLQKDPSLRPSASELLKHKFFKNRKAREYLVSTVLSVLPPQGERSCVMEISQVPPSVLPSENADMVRWDFMEEDDSAPLATSLESLLSSSKSSSHSHFSEEGASSVDSFFDEWFATPSSANLLDQASHDDPLDDFQLHLQSLNKVAPTPANTIQGTHGEDLKSSGAFEMQELMLGCMQLAAPTPANTMQGRDFATNCFETINLNTVSVDHQGHLTDPHNQFLSAVFAGLNCSQD